MWVDEVEEGTVERLKRRPEQVEKEEKELEAKVLKLEGDLLDTKTIMNVMSIHVGLLEEERRNISPAPESLFVTNQEIK